MLRLLSIYFIFFSANIVVAQTTRVAILDFDNISGIAKYDGLGKAMSSMLITDIEANVSPKRLQLVERAQIQKILKEQNFQSSSSVDKSTTVLAGKILGVKYLLVGDIYIMDDVLVINARLTDTETGDIKFSKKQEGKLSTWLMLKTNIAKELASSLTMPFTDPNIPDVEINVATITTFGNALIATDEGKIDRAEELLNTVLEFSPDFKYLDDLKGQLDILKKQVEKNTASIQILERSGGRIINANSYDELKNNLVNGLTSSAEQLEYLVKLFDNYPLETEQNINLYCSYPTVNYSGYSEESFLNDVMIIKDLKSRALNKRIYSKYSVERLKFLSNYVVSSSYGLGGPANLKDVPIEKRMPKIIELTRQLRELIVLLEIEELEKNKLGLFINYQLINAFIPLDMRVDDDISMLTLLSISSFNEIDKEIKYYTSSLFSKNESWMNFVFSEIDKMVDYVEYCEWLVKYSSKRAGAFLYPHEFTQSLKNIFLDKSNPIRNFYVLSLGNNYEAKKAILNSIFLTDSDNALELDLKEFEKQYLITIKESEFFVDFMSSVIKKISKVEGEKLNTRYFQRILLFKNLPTDCNEIICLF